MGVTYPDDLAGEVRTLGEKLAEANDELAQLRFREATPSIDVGHILGQIEWSLKTFGPGPRTRGITKHIRKELSEIEADPTDLLEWVDVIILAMDGAWRTGASALDIIRAIKKKQAINQQRAWPDWRTISQDEPSEHVR